ncbi:SRPBCC family protein [Actinoplanes sp. NPDC049265]|uniref:SRPBCC family protein n=1 Tax=Actinoplanes sp. NPDC049265 TaxID=3363902 RepID=UPI003723A923
MPLDNFSTTFRLGAPPAPVIAFLNDPHSYIGLAPLVVAVRDIRVTGDETRYVSVERFRLGPFHWDNAIDVTIQVAPGRVVNTVRSPGWVRLTATVTLTEAGDGCDGTETIELRAPWFLRAFALRKAREAQTARVAGLTARFPVL